LKKQESRISRVTKRANKKAAVLAAAQWYILALGGTKNIQKI
jgi:hypothetical protein